MLQGGAQKLPPGTKAGYKLTPTGDQVMIWRAAAVHRVAPHGVRRGDVMWAGLTLWCGGSSGGSSTDNNNNMAGAECNYLGGTNDADRLSVVNNAKGMGA